MYQQVNLADHTLVGQPGSLPASLRGLLDSTVADISATCNPPPPGMAGQGWWPVVIAPPATFDSRSQAIVDPTSLLADPTTTTVRGQQTTRPLTSTEISTLPPRQATFAQISAAFDDLGLTSAVQVAWVKLKPLAQAYLSSHYSDLVPETNAKVAKLVGLVASVQTTNPTLTTSALYDKAVTE